MENLLPSPDLILCKDGDGHVYWPEFSINTIGDWLIENGYQCYYRNPAPVIMAGGKIVPQDTPLDMPAGWSLVAYLRDNPLAIEQALSTVEPQLFLAKNSAGQVYWPDYEVNQIGQMQPGQGYQMVLLESGTLLYPAN